MVAANQSSPIHPASLVDTSFHSPAVLELLDIKMSTTLIEYLFDRIDDAVHVALEPPCTSTSTSHGRSHMRDSERTKLIDFLSEVLRKAEVQVPVLLVTLAYIERAKPYLNIAVPQYAHERVFLGALILAYKYVNDATLKNYHWAICTGIFGSKDIGRIEREFLQVLDYSLNVTEDHILIHHQGIISLTLPQPESRHRSPLRDYDGVSVDFAPLVASQWSSDSGSELDSDDESFFSASPSPQTPQYPIPADPFVVTTTTSETSVSLTSPTKKSSEPRSSALKFLQSLPIPLLRPTSVRRPRHIMTRV